MNIFEKNDTEVVYACIVNIPIIILAIIAIKIGTF